MIIENTVSKLLESLPDVSQRPSVYGSSPIITVTA